MVYCSKCGAKNDDNAEFCSKCGKKMFTYNKKDKFEKQAKKTEKLIEEKAEQFGEAIEKAGKRFELKMENTFKDFQKWYDNKFKIIGPLIWSFLGLIILRFIILLFKNADDIDVLMEIGDFLYSYLLILFGLMLLNTYNSYFNRVYKKQYRLVSPAVSVISFVISLWIISKIFIILDTNLDIAILTTIANFINNYIILIFVIVLLLSYIFVLFIVPFEKDNKK
jgi:ribosomal protein L40E